MATNNVLPPNNIEAEEAVLGSLMIDPSEIRNVSTVITATDFYVLRNGWIFEAIVECGDSADLMTISEALTRKNRLDDVGNVGYLTQIMAAVVYAGNVRSYAEIVRERSQRRKMLQAGQLAAKGAYNLEQSVQVTLAEVANAINGVYSEAKTTGVTFLAAQDSIAEFLNDESPRHHIATGIDKADEILKGGFLIGSYVILGGAPGSGKTIAATQVLYNAMMSGSRCIYYSFEVPRNAIIARLISHHIAKTGGKPVPYGAMIDRRMTDEQRNAVNTAWIELVDKVRDNVMINDAATMTSSQLTNSAIAFALKGGCDLIVVDQLHHMSDDDKKSDTKQRISNISRELSRLGKRIHEATQHRAPLVLALARLNRVGYAAPDMSALKESGDIESDAEMIAFLYRDTEKATADPTAATPIFFKVAKNRNGPTDFALNALMMGSINRIGDAK